MTESEYRWQTEALRQAQAAIGRGAHALLLTGAKGMGKRALALQLAASYLCAARDAALRACGSCESCRWLAAGTHPDMVLLEPAADGDGGETGEGIAGVARARPISIDQVRSVGEGLALTAHRDAGRVVVIHPAESLNAPAANALLKNLEEPPPRTLFLLVSNRSALLPPTVRSRCQAISVRLNDWALAEDWLRSQGLADAIPKLALCGGAPLEALAVSTDPAYEQRRALLSELSADGANAISLAAKYRDLAPLTLLSWIQKWSFDLLLMRYAGRARYHQDLSVEISKWAGRIDPVALTRLHRRLLSAQRHIHHPLNPRLLAERLLIECRELLESAQAGRA